MTVAQVAFAVLASVCAGGALVAITRRDPRSAVVGLAAVLIATAALLVTLGATSVAVAHIVLYAIGGTIPLMAALGRLPALRAPSDHGKRPRLAFAAALIGVGATMLVALAVLRTVLPEALPAPEAGVAFDAVASELLGRRTILLVALLMVPVAGIIVSGVARRSPPAQDR